MRVGRYWHATRILRRLEQDGSDPVSTLLLARAEAGWKNWPAVRETLEGAEWLNATEAGAGWFLLGQAYEDGERWDDAAGAYQAYVDVAPTGTAERTVAMARLARVTARADRAGDALAALDAIPSDREVVRSWEALELASRAAEAGDTAEVVAYLGRVSDPTARGRGWRLLPSARLEVGDSVGAERDFRAVAATATGNRRGEALVEVGALTLARADTAAARKLFAAALDDAPVRSAGRAAAGLIATGTDDLNTTLRLAVILDRAGSGGPALRAYDRAKRQAAEAGTELSFRHRIARARLMGTVRSRREEAIEEFRAIRSEDPGDEVGPRNLDAWIALRQRQGRTGDVRTLRRWLVEEYPSSAQATEVLWERGSSAQTRGEVGAALRDYAAIMANTPTLNRAGEARMRTGQIELGRGNREAAASVYEAYLRDFPEGRRWEEATYWAARTRLQLGDTSSARKLVARIRSEEPVSYYAVMGARLLDQPYEVDVPAGPDPVEPSWLPGGLARLDALAEAGLEQGVEAEEGYLVEQAGEDVGAQLALAEALNARGRTIAGINLGWAARREGQAWDRRLLRVVYPFPYRELVVREAAEWGLDPFMLAALIRQESAFKADIKSGAGAVGLMQVMPPTGKELARAYGPDEFQEASLTTPEVNLHLGAAFFIDMSRRYDGDLTLVLSAYNAGPTRATRWKRYPEAADAERFTERIPFDETRGYVKNVRRNLDLYQALYGDGE